MNTATSPLLELKNVMKQFILPQGEVRVLEDINLKASRGEFLSIVGPSGAGKSTLLRLIAGLTPPTQGKILYKGKVQTDVNLQAAMIFQDFALLPWLTVAENVELGLESRMQQRKERRKRVEYYVERVGLEGYEEAYPRELSGGMKQRVGIARALAVEPKVLIMDEPFSSLDVLTSINLRDELLEIWDDDDTVHTIIMVTHMIEEAVELADRIIVLSNRPGKIAGEIEVKLPRPREKTDPGFMETVDKVFSLLA